MQRKTQGRNSHYIGNKEQKHTCHNKSEKTMDSRKTLTGCGLSLFYSKKIIGGDEVRIGEYAFSGCAENLSVTIQGKEYRAENLEKGYE